MRIPGQNLKMNDVMGNPIPENKRRNRRVSLRLYPQATKHHLKIVCPDELPKSGNDENRKQVKNLIRFRS